MPFSVHSTIATATLLLAASVAAQTTAAPTTSAAAPAITAVSDCHPHGTVKYVLSNIESMF
jgi:zinc transporter 1/2/3